MGDNIKINKGGEGTWNIPKEGQTNVLERVHVDLSGKGRSDDSLKFDEGETPVEYDSEENKINGTLENQIKQFIGEREYEGRLLELSKAEAEQIGKKTLGVLDGEK